MAQPAAPSLANPVIVLGRAKSQEKIAFAFEPDAERCRAIAEELGLIGLKKLSFRGVLRPEGQADWRLEADLGARVVQACVATLEPVTTRIDVSVVRQYLADPPPLPEADEIEMPADDHIEALPHELDLAAVMVEALSLHVPLYPRLSDTDPVAQTFTAPGVTPLTDEAVKPFAELAAFRDKLGKKQDG
ncbi:MAG: DUF177 domain-containing protein [Pseudomonadota bacterium]